MYLNVIMNAVEAAGPDGSVEVAWGIGSDRRAFVEIRDSGPGLEPEIHNRLFEPFVTSKREGVGLGLAVARQVAEAHGGSIRWARAESPTRFPLPLPAPVRGPESVGRSVSFCRLRQRGTRLCGTTHGQRYDL